jgi:MFS transporter, SHS family, lactate transporter
MLGNTLNACWWMASAFITYYSVTVLFATHLQVDLKLSPGAIGEVAVAANLVTFLASVGWGFVADRYGRRAAAIIPALIAIPLAPVFLLSTDFILIWWGLVLQGAAAVGGMQGQLATYMNERFSTEVRAAAGGFCYHQGAIWGGLVAPIIAYFATSWGFGYPIQWSARPATSLHWC